MKLKILLAGVIAGVLLAVSSTVFASPILNGGFEMGLTGWTTSSTSTSGFVEVVTTCPTSGTPSCAAPFAPYQATEGGRFALLWSRGSGTMTLRSNGVRVEPGSVVTGRAFFADGQLAAATAPCDTATVRILLDSSGPTTVFTQNSCATSGVDSTPWTGFQFVSQYTGTLSVEAVLLNTGNQERVSTMGLDALQITDPPRPSLGAFLGGADGTRDNLARQAAANAAAQQAAVAAATAASAPSAGALRPPSTGDAGLLNQSSDSSYGLVALAAVLGLSVMGAGALRLRVGATQR